MRCEKRNVTKRNHNGRANLTDPILSCPVLSCLIYSVYVEYSRVEQCWATTQATTARVRYRYVCLPETEEAWVEDVDNRWWTLCLPVHYIIYLLFNSSVEDCQVFASRNEIPACECEKYVAAPNLSTSNFVFDSFNCKEQTHQRSPIWTQRSNVLLLPRTTTTTKQYVPFLFRARECQFEPYWLS